MEWSESITAEGGSPVNTSNDYKKPVVSNKSMVQQYSDEAVERNKEYINIGWCINCIQKDDHFYVLIVREWYGKWGISPCLQGVTLASLLRQLSSINEGVQLTALATCGKVTSVGIAYLVTSNEDSNTSLSTSDDSLALEGYTSVMKQLTERLEKLLDSESIPVRVGAAIVICALGVINSEV